MGTFTLTQQLVKQNFYMYPNGDLSTCTEFAAVGNNPNYACVDDDRLSPNEDTDYVWWTGDALGLDLYELQNHTTEAGTINYVQVYARTKAQNTAQKADGIFKIICSPDSVCSHTYESDDIDLVTNYTTYSKVWKINPIDSLPFEWADIDTFCAGVKCNSPIIEGAEHLFTLRPNAPGFSADNTPVGAPTNWECVDETTVDDDTTYAWMAGGGGYEIDLHNCQNHTTEAGTITKITLHVITRTTSLYAGFSWKLMGAIRIGGTSYYSSWTNVTTSYTDYSFEWATNPGGGNWTWADIDNIQIGFAQQSGSGTCEIRTTQVYAVVEYNDDTNPEIRTTQVYAKVNYTAATLECTLNTPRQVSTNHKRNTKMLNFWDGTREVYDLNRSGKSMMLAGSEMYDGSCDRVLCARDMARNGQIVVIAGLSLGYFNGNYRMNQFGWKKISEKPEHYEWIMQLEDAEL